MTLDTDPAPATPRRLGVRIATYALAAACALSPFAARAADDGDSSWIAWALLVGVALLVAGILIRAAMGSDTPPGWMSFIARRRAEGRPTTWREWPDD